MFGFYIKLHVQVMKLASLEARTNKQVNLTGAPESEARKLFLKRPKKVQITLVQPPPPKKTMIWSHCTPSKKENIFDSL